MDKVTIVGDLPQISRWLELLEPINSRFSSADQLDCFDGVPNLGQSI